MSQSLSNVILHIIFSTKNRNALIDCEIESELYAYLITTLASHGSYTYEIGGVEDHIHLCCTLPRIVSISNLLEEIKKNSSKWIKTKGYKYNDFAWQRGYGVFSVSHSQCIAVKTYIQNQKEHHKKITFQDEYREFLRRHKVSYDEKYVWE